MTDDRASLQDILETVEHIEKYAAQTGTADRGSPCEERRHHGLGKGNLGSGG